VRYLLDHFGWNSKHAGSVYGQLGWTRLIEEEWLSDENINGVMHDIQTHVAADPVLEASTLIAFLSFQTEITKFATQKHKDRVNKRFLARYADAIRGGKSVMYFPLHVNRNHWIEFKIDFGKKTFGYGMHLIHLIARHNIHHSGDSMSRSSEPKRFPFMSHLEKWLSAEFPGKFTNLGDCLVHSIQKDSIHCGIYTLNTLKHALFGSQLLQLADCKRVRIDWFKKFMHRAGLQADTVRDYGFNSSLF
jgi:hypothetical protein